jgi:hypothetical protein
VNAILTVVMVWTLLSVPASLLLGRALAAQETTPGPALVAPRSHRR